MTSLRHDPRRRPRTSPAAVQASVAAVWQPAGSTGRQTVPNTRRRPSGMHITTQRNGPVTTVRVSGGLTEIGTRQLGALLDAMVTAGCEQTIVHLTDVKLLDSGLLRVLRAARTRLQGRLTVTADRTEARFPLALVGLGQGVSPAHHEDLGARRGSCLALDRRTGAVGASTSTPSLNAPHASCDGESEVDRDATVRA